jgi:phage shock protein PspC (stress-responsive transcriptional regulator)
MTGYCSNCGSVLPFAARFCSVCGTVVTGVPPSYTYPPYAARLVRPIFGRQFAGVCIGLARAYGWDVGLVRILAVVTGIFIFPIPEIFYLAAWIGIPEETPGDVPLTQAQPPQQS